MNPIFLIAGAPAVGKSTVGKALAATYPRSVHIKVDDIRSMVVSGLVHPGRSTPELIEQASAARASAIAMAHIYHDAGFAVVIDDYYDPHSDLEEYETLTATRILLYPSSAKALERNINRSGYSEHTEYIARGIDAVYSHIDSRIDRLQQEGWIVLDTSDQAVQETVQEIAAISTR